MYSDRLSVVKRLLDRYEEYAVNLGATDEDIKAVSDSIVCGDVEIEEEEILDMLNSVTLPYWYHVRTVAFDDLLNTLENEHSNTGLECVQ